MAKVIFGILLGAWVWVAGNLVVPDRDPAAEVHMLDVGQGDAALLELGEDKQVLIDGGPDQRAAQELGKRMPRFDRRLELVVVSHPHLDHYGGLLEILDRYKVDTLLVNQSSQNEAYRRLLRKARQSGTAIVPAHGQSFAAGHGTLKVLYPREAGQGRGEVNPNDASIVIRLDLFGHRFLFPGDAEESEERRLIPIGTLDSDVLKVPHHGSRTSSTEKFLSATSPRWCVISLGQANRYGHPHRATRERLLNSGCRTLRTDEQGTVTFSINEGGLRVSTER